MTITTSVEDLTAYHKLCLAWYRERSAMIIQKLAYSYTTTNEYPFKPKVNHEVIETLEKEWDALHPFPSLFPKL